MKLLVYALAFWVATQGIAQPFKKSFTESQSLEISAGKVKTVIVENLFGKVQVKAGPAESLSYSVEKNYFGGSQSELDRTLKDVQLATIHRNDSLILYIKSPCSCNQWEGDCENRNWGLRGVNYDFRFDFDLTVPANTILEVSTVDKGSITIEGVKGEIRAGNVNGSVYVKGARLLSKASTINGDVEVYFEEKPLMNAAFSNISGNIDLYFRETASVDVYSKSLSGELYSAFDYVALPAKVTKLTEKDGAETRYSIGNTSGISIGKNGPVLTMETISGNMYLRKL